MIAGIFHEGSGLGNQLHRYVMTRTLALDKGMEFGMMSPHKFKGHDFMNLDMGKSVNTLSEMFGDRTMNFFNEKSEKNADGNEVRDYDWEGILNIKDDTVIDGEFQGEKYYEHHLDKIREWLKVEPLKVPDDVCVIGFRGGEYIGVPDLFLKQEYWDAAISLMRGRGINKFQVETDDVETAHKFFPDFQLRYNIGWNWRSVRYAKHLIIANSSFYILPALLGDAKEIIAPQFWAGHNKGYWQLKQNQYKRFTYI